MRAGALAWASRNRSTNSCSIASGSWAIFAVAVAVDRGVLQPVQRALAGQRRAPRPARLQPAENRPEHRIATQIVVVVQILVAEGDAEHPLADQRADVVNDAPRRPPVGKAGGEPVDQLDRLVGRAQQQRPGGPRLIAPPPKSATRSRRSRRAKSIDSGLHCVRIGGSPDIGPSVCSHSHSRRFQTPMHLPS